jgi:hypothetical protein
MACTDRVTGALHVCVADLYFIAGTVDAAHGVFIVCRVDGCTFRIVFHEIGFHSGLIETISVQNYFDLRLRQRIV